MSSSKKMSRREQRKQQLAQKKRRQTYIIASIVTAIVLIIAAVAFFRPSGGVTLRDIHGLSFPADGRQLIVPAHDGLRFFANGEWSASDLPVNDYMGYAAMDEGFYSSGHPGPGSSLPNPLGLVKSTDGGETLQQLAFLGESDFHLMGVGYESHAIYILNGTPNSQLDTGLYYSLDDGETWNPAIMQGITERLANLAVHPTEANQVALATEGGLFLSTDYGDSFIRIGNSASVTAVAFHPDGQTLLFGANQLSTYDLASQQVTAVPTPAVAADDTIGYIAVNPVQSEEIALATFSKDIYLSPDGGQTWQQIAEDGKG